jgi:plasmid maintenance system antidote protein VapI
MTRHMEKTRIVGEYVRARLVLECKVRGRAYHIAQKIGFAPIHISLVLRGKRSVGLALAKAMAEFWGLDYEGLERMAYEAHGLTYIPEESVRRDLPNLQSTISWCLHGKVYPPSFLRTYEREAEQGGADRSAREWMLDLESKYAIWDAKRLAKLAGKREARELARGTRTQEERSGVYAKHAEVHGKRPRRTKRTGS